MGWLLGLDGATETLTLALVRADGSGGQSRRLAGGAQASSQLLPALLELLRETGVAPTELLAIGYGRGPGAFTSLRVVCAVTQGLSEGWRLPVLALDSLLLSVDEAAGAPPAEGLWAAVMDARMGEVYAASYRRAAGAWTPLMPPSLWQPAALQTAWAEGAQANPDYLAGHGVPLLSGASAQPAQDRGAALARLLVRAWQTGPRLDASAAQPLYVRDRVALTTAEREAQRAGAAAS